MLKMCFKNTNGLIKKINIYLIYFLNTFYQKQNIMSVALIYLKYGQNWDVQAFITTYKTNGNAKKIHFALYLFSFK